MSSNVISKSDDAILCWIDDGAVVSPEEAAAARRAITRYTDDPEEIEYLIAALFEEVDDSARTEEAEV